mgnify:FL=1
MSYRASESTLGVKGKEVTRRRILDAATDVFSEKGYHGSAVDDIVKKSNTSKGSFYFHFPSKQDIFFALIDRLTSSLTSSAEEAISGEVGALAKIDIALKIVAKTFSKHSKLAKLLLVGGVGLGKVFDEKMLDLHDRFALLIKKYLDKAVSEGSVDQMDTFITAYAWVGALNEVIVHWLYRDGTNSLETSMESLRDVFLRSINAENNISGGNE